MSAAAIGAEGSRFVLGRHSSRTAFRQRLEDLGLLLTPEEMTHAFAGFQQLTDSQSQVTDEDLQQLARTGRTRAEGVMDAIGHVYR
jgi:2-isopropylmalate synthase